MLRSCVNVFTTEEQVHKTKGKGGPNTSFEFFFIKLLLMVGILFITS